LHRVIYVKHKFLEEIKMDSNQQKLIAGSRRIAFAFSVLFWAGALWLFSEVAWRPIKALVAALNTPGAGPAAIDLAHALLNHTPVFALMGALWTAIGLFRRFAQGEALSPASGRALSVIGGWFLASVLAAALFTDDVHAPPVTGFTAPLAVDAEIVLGCVGAALVLLGRAFAAAAAIKADHDQIV